MKFFANNVSTPVRSIFVLFAFIGLISCRKNNDDQPPSAPASPAEGFWQGHYRITGSIANNNLKMLIKPGGIARVYDMDTKTDTAELAASSKTDATWSLTNDKLEVAFVSDGPILFSGTIKPDEGKWTGSWKKNGDVKGTFSQSK